MGAIEQSGSVPGGTAGGRTIQGTVMGGQQPVVGTTIQLYAAGMPASGGGYGTGAVALIPTKSTSVGYFPGGASGCVAAGPITCTALPTTDSNGGFTISNDYSCPSATSQVYLVATGGNPQLTGGSANPYITMVTALGPCNSTNTLGNPSLNLNSLVIVNEITTIASVYALNQFMSAPVANTLQGIGAPGATYNGVQSGIVGLINAFSMVNNIVDTTRGIPVTTNPNVIFLESATINTLADILAYCVNSDPNNATTPSANCSTLMTDATPAGKTTATDTLQAAYYMVHYPYNNVAKLITDIPPTPPFTAASSASDFTLQVQMEPSYYSTGVSQIEPAVGKGVSIALDQYGNVWIQNIGITAVGNYTNSPSVTEIGQNGNVLLAPVTVFNASTTGGAYSEFTNAPSSNIRSFTGTGGTIAIDTTNNAWVTNKGDTGTTPTSGSVAVFPGSSAVNAVNNGTPTGYYTGTTPDGIAIDGSNNVFIAAVGNAASAGIVAGKSINEFVAGSGSGFTYSAITKTTAPYALLGGNTKLAIDQNTGVTNTANSTANDGPVLWTVDQTDCSVSGIAYGTLHQYTTKDLAPTGNSAISSNSGCPTTSAVTSVIPSTTGDPNNIAIDRNNNVWLTDVYSTATTGFDGVTFIQLPSPAAPTDAIDPTYGSVTYDPYGIGVKGSSNTAGGVSFPYMIAIDGNNNAWVGNNGISFITEFTATLGGVNATTGALTSAPTLSFVIPKGVAGHQTAFPEAVAIDSSGNVWSANATNIAANGALLPLTTRADIINILVGAAAPVVTPLSVAIANKKLGQTP